MKAYSRRDVRYIIEEFLAKHFNFLNVDLNDDSLEVIDEICKSYGLEIESIVENN